MLGIVIVLSTFAFGGMLLIVFLGARRIEDEFAEKTRVEEAIRAKAAWIPRFFVVTPPTAPRVGPLDDAFLGQLQQYLDAEQTLADEFVLQPSVENLYRDSGRKLTAH